MSDYMKQGVLYGAAFVGITAGTLLGVTVLLKMERPPITAVQRGFRGTGMDQIYNPRTLEALAVASKVPGSLPPASPEGVKASAAYKNVKVLGNISVGQFTRLMVSITGWVAPKQGCAYCHNVANMADDSVYTKVVARRMIQMVQNINGNWQSHVQKVGVTCYTCHGGNPVPKNIWFNNPGPEAANGQVESRTGMAHPTMAINYSSLPYDPFTPYLEGSHDIRVQSTTALPTDDMHSIKETEWTYALMVHFSQSLGVNCTYCHNSRSLSDWSQSSPARVNAWYGIRMVRDINNAYLDPLQSVFPDYRKGQMGDSPKVNCATCHQGVYKPLYGASMVSTFPELQASTTEAKAAIPSPAEAAPPPSETAPPPAEVAPGPGVPVLPAQPPGVTPATPH